MSIAGYIILFSLLGSVGALCGAGVILRFPELRERLRTLLLSYAVGTLLGATFIGLLPEALEQRSGRGVLLTTLIGFVTFFVFEKVLRIPHRHAQQTTDSGRHGSIQPAAHFILLGDALHNFVDGVMIATSFFVSVPLGILTSFAVIAHELPQELGDFVILLESGMRRTAAYWLNFLSALGTLFGALATYGMRGEVQGMLPFILAISASSFLYVAAVDLAPILHRQAGMAAAIKQTAGLIFGILTIGTIHYTLG